MAKERPKCQHCKRQVFEFWFDPCCLKWRADWCKRNGKNVFCETCDQCQDHCNCKFFNGPVLGDREWCEVCKKLDEGIAGVGKLTTEQYMESLEAAGMI